MLDVSVWDGVELVERIDEGNRNEVWRATRGDVTLASRRSRRSRESLEWELRLLDVLRHRGFLVPAVVPTDEGRLHHEGVVVQRWIDGRPPDTAADWRSVADELQRLHALTGEHPQRPGCCVVTELRRARVSVDADLDAVPGDARRLIKATFAEFADVPTAVVHGDPGRSNIRITDAGEIGLLDWDESRVDLTWHDLSNLGVRVLDPDEHERAQALSHAWEAANGWLAEPEYAVGRLARLRRTS